MDKKFRHPERSHPKGGAVEGPFLLMPPQERSLHYASLRSAPVGMTDFCHVRVPCASGRDTKAGSTP